MEAISFRAVICVLCGLINTAEGFFKKAVACAGSIVQLIIAHICQSLAGAVGVPTL